MISVCIATHNGAKYIEQQLRSILDQIGKEDEIVLSDDASTDGTLDIVESLHDSRIRVLKHDPNLIATHFPLDKPTHNFANALRHAKGDYIFLADQDDVWLPGKVISVMEYLEKYDFVMHDCTIVNERLETEYLSFFKYHRVRTGILQNLIRTTCLGCCMAMRRKVVEAALPMPQTKVGHDLWLYIIAMKQFNVKLLNKPLILYRRHESTMTPFGQKKKYGLCFKINYRITILKNIIELFLKK